MEDTYQPLKHKNFNPRSPRGERPANSVKPLTSAVFQSTLPSRGATGNHEPENVMFNNFNPRSPRGERPPSRIACALTFPFQSTLPSRGATGVLTEQLRYAQIPIHAPLAGSDASP